MEKSLETYLEERLALWPETISLKDASFIKETNGYIFPELSIINDRLEEFNTNEMEDILNWSIFKRFHKLMIIRHERGDDVVLRSEIDRKKLREVFLEDILEDGDKDLLSMISSFEDVNMIPPKDDISCRIKTPYPSKSSRRQLDPFFGLR